MSEKIINLYNRYKKEYEETGKNKDLYIQYYKKIKETKLIQRRNDEKDLVYTTIVGGLGNQLFQLFNLIANAKKFNKEFYYSFDKKYKVEYLKKCNTVRKESCEYSLFSKLSEIKKKTSSFTDIYEKEFRYNPIQLKKNISYHIHGYFQSWKYFWDYREEIKKNLYINPTIFQRCKEIVKNFKKETLALHIRMGDYNLLSEIHPMITIEYIKKSLSYYDLEKYQLLLFSDDTENALKLIKPLNLNIKNVNDIFKNDEEQFILLSLTNIRICSNSSFSLMSCYFNEMYQWVENTEYIFPSKWFGKKGPNYHMDDFMLNYKFFHMDNYNSIKNFNVISTLHIKDSKRYEKYLPYNKKFIKDCDDFYYISEKNFNIKNGNFINENNYSFSKKDVFNYLGNYVKENRKGWYYQQLLKLYVFEIEHLFKNKYDYVLIFDSDILFFKSLCFFKNNKPILYKRNTGNGSIHRPYIFSSKYINPVLDISENDSGICHLMLFHKKTLFTLKNEIEKIHKKEFWKVCLDSVIHYVLKYGTNGSILSEYELYYAYVKNLNLYTYIHNLEYVDISIKKYDITSKKNFYIGDHDYMSR